MLNSQSVRVLQIEQNEPPHFGRYLLISYNMIMSLHMGGVSWTHRDQPRNGTIGEAVKDHLSDIGLNDLPLSRGLRGPTLV